MHQRNARGVGHLLLLAAIAGAADAQESVRLRTLEYARDQQPTSPVMLTIPLEQLTDVAALQGYPTRPAAKCLAMAIHDFCALGFPAEVDVEQAAHPSGARVLRIWLPAPEVPAKLYRFQIEVAPVKQPPLFAWETSPHESLLSQLPPEIWASRGARPWSLLAAASSPFDSKNRDATYKVYDAIYSHGGSKLLSKGAGGDYPHHRGVFLGWSKVRTGGRLLDFWHCKEPATIRHDRFEPEHQWLGRAHATFARRIRWCEEQETVLTERRQITAWGSMLPGTCLDYEIELLAFQPIELDGDPHHGGFQIRVAQEVHDNPDATEFLRPEDAHAEGNDVWRGGRWCAIRFPLAGETHQIAMLDHPGNGDPPQWSTRAYGRFGAFRRHTLQPGIPLVLRYRLIVALDWERTRFTPQFLDARWREWIEPPTPKILR